MLWIIIIFGNNNKSGNVCKETSDYFSFRGKSRFNCRVEIRGCAVVPASSSRGRHNNLLSSSSPMSELTVFIPFLHGGFYWPNLFRPLFVLSAARPPVRYWSYNCNDSSAMFYSSCVGSTWREGYFKTLLQDIVLFENV